MGLGRFGGGAAVARWHAERGHDVTVTDLRSEAELADSVRSLEHLGLRFRLGRHEESDFVSTDRLVVNQAVPFENALVALAKSRGVEVVTELGLTLKELRGPILAITGTNGKSTTSALAASMLDRSGVPVILGGNIGRSLLNEAAALPEQTVAVLELSSFQLAWLEHDGLAPSTVVVTNVSGDHFDKHPDRAHYQRAKARLVESAPAHATVVLREDDPVCRDYASLCRGRIVWFGPGRDSPVALDGLQLLGEHNRQNAAAAAHAALSIGASEAGCLEAIASFEPLPHRLERIATRDGAVCIDDSVSTTPEAAAAAVRALPGPVLLLSGGRDKGLDWDPLLAAAKHAKGVIGYGETGRRLCKSLPNSHLGDNFDSAVRLALELAQPGDFILLSPGFSSYDEFPGFDARGQRFRELIGVPPR